MNKMLMMLALMCAMMLGAAALADGPVLMLELPEDALLVEDVQFEDGDFIQTYQLPGGVRVQMLRYAAFDMTLTDLAEGEWTGYTGLQTLDITQVDGCPAQGVTLTHRDEAGGETIVYMVMAEAEGQKLLLTAAFPAEIGGEKAQADVNAWLSTMTIAGFEDEEVG